MIPELDKHGLLPPQIHDCTLDEISTVFGWNAQRRYLIEQLKLFISKELHATGLFVPVIVDGSFVRSKELPQDIDLVLVLGDIDDIKALALGLALKLRHDEIKRQYKLDIYADHKSYNRSMSEYFFNIGVKASADIGLPPDHKKGLLRIHNDFGRNNRKSHQNIAGKFNF